MSSFDFGLPFLNADRMTYWACAGSLNSGSKTRVSNGTKRRFGGFKNRFQSAVQPSMHESVAS